MEYLHALGIVHRDLKLENVLVAQDGALKLTDFGFAKKIKYRSWTLCGTPEYLAPEIILEKGHGKAVDWWAFGVLFYEMLNGHSPFEAEDHLATYQKILDGTVNYPSKMPALAVDLVGKLLQKDITRRYGNLKDGAGDIKNHAVYKEAGHEFSWDSAFAQRASVLPDKFDKGKYEWVAAAPSSPRRSRARTTIKRSSMASSGGLKGYIKVGGRSVGGTVHPQRSARPRASRAIEPPTASRSDDGPGRDGDARLRARERAGGERGRKARGSARRARGGWLCRWHIGRPARHVGGRAGGNATRVCRNAVYPTRVGRRLVWGDEACLAAAGAGSGRAARRRNARHWVVRSRALSEILV